ncbi:HAMP domain-containing histidine kinase [Fructobacillus sp. W13]|uniref:histidine kinase n=1 Tax=Fructobacillus apis TaxID=2935017 RepID=A0ABT0ZRL7_9LACO|nr:HAMP domain-containing sensor histidine kinase [Fructobacillus apis]MCO0832636.1 HAMP domain-containing histidine kinase [Fructobacillus apis]
MAEEKNDNLKNSPFKSTQAVLTLGLTVGFLLISLGLLVSLGLLQGGESLGRFLRAIENWWWVFIPLSLAGIFLLSFFLAKFFVRPVKRLSKVMEAFEENPRTKHRMARITYNQELDQLGQLLNQTMDQVQSLIGAQQEFVSDVSHELRTPVAIVKGHLNLLNRWGKDDKEVLEDSLTSSLAEINRMETLVNEMLQLTRAEKMTVSADVEKTAVAPVLKRVYHEFELLHPEFVWTLDNTVNDKAAIAIRPDHLEQLLIILLDNAVKYSKDRKEVHLALARAGSWLEIGVQDFGQGIGPEDIDRVFDRFYRVDKAREHQVGGNGLGLSIVKKMVSAYGGRVEVESALGSGSSFRLSFPMSVLEYEKSETVID